ncbi:MAG: translation initiation factor IF-2, partial [Desulfovibrio sp.]|nr:translation initiation factor IF-2 [Desulfovibrio sp.]
MKFITILSLAFAICFAGSGVLAKSAYSPRHSGIEPPGGPRSLEAIPGRSPSRTAEGGMGYMDAYG